MLDRRLEAEKKERFGFPEKDVTELLKECGVKDEWKWNWKGGKKEGTFVKMEEKKITPKVFWQMESKDVIKELDITNFGAKTSLKT